MSTESCALLVLPDAFELGLGDDVIRWLRARFLVLNTHWIAPFDRADLEMLYPGTGAWNPGWDLKLALLSWGPSMLVEVAPECWPAIPAAKGPSSPWLAAQGTLRGDLDAIGTVLALVHAADTVGAAQADMRRLSARRATAGHRSPGIGARSFPGALALALTGLGADSARVLASGDVARGPMRLAALQQGLDAVAREEPGCILAEWRNWGLHTAADTRAHLQAHGKQLDPWSDLVFAAGVHFLPPSIAMPRLRLVLLPRFFLPTTGGLQNATARIGESLARRGWQVSAHFPAAPADRPAPPQCRSPFNAVAHEGSRASFWSGISRIVDGDLHDTAILAVGLEYDDDLDRQIDALAALRRRGARVVLRVTTTHDVADRITEARARTLAEIDGIVVLNARMEAEAACWPALNGKVQRIPVMVDTARYAPDPRLRQRERDHFGIEAGRAVVLCAGRLDERKRAGRVVEAMCGVDALLWFVGDALDSGRAIVEQLRKLATELGVRDVRCDPGVAEDQMPALLAAADVLVTASAREGMSNAVLEAASSGLAVAGYAIPGIQETALGLGNAGFYLCDPRSGALGLRAALSAALADRPESGWRTARDVGLEQFSMTTVSAQWNALLGGTL